MNPNTVTYLSEVQVQAPQILNQVNVPEFKIPQIINNIDLREVVEAIGLIKRSNGKMGSINQYK